MALLARLEAAGVAMELSPDGVGLDLQAATAPAADLLAEMRRLKPEIMALLLAERAANDARPSQRFDMSEGGKCPPSAPVAPADDPAGPDEERAVMMPAKAHAETVAALLRAASPLAGTPGARPCRSCGRGIWVSPSSPGPHPPDLCGACRWTSAP